MVGAEYPWIIELRLTSSTGEAKEVLAETPGEKEGGYNRVDSYLPATDNKCRKTLFHQPLRAYSATRKTLFPSRWIKKQE